VARALRRQRAPARRAERHRAQARREPWCRDSARPALPGVRRPKACAECRRSGASKSRGTAGALVSRPREETASTAPAAESRPQGSLVVPDRWRDARVVWRSWSTRSPVPRKWAARSTRSPCQGSGRPRSTRVAVPRKWAAPEHEVAVPGKIGDCSLTFLVEPPRGDFFSSLHHRRHLGFSPASRQRRASTAFSPCRRTIWRHRPGHPPAAFPRGTHSRADPGSAGLRPRTRASLGDRYLCGGTRRAQPVLRHRRAQPVLRHQTGAACLEAQTGAACLEAQTAGRSSAAGARRRARGGARPPACRRPPGQQGEAQLPPRPSPDAIRSAQLSRTLPQARGHPVVTSCVVM